MRRSNNAIRESKPCPRIAKFERLAFGLFMHWGLYSQLGKGEWIQHLEPIPREKYIKLRDRFTADAFDARRIARLAKESGMKYICLTSRHHEGFSLYDTRGLNNYDAPHSPARRDLVREFVEGCKAEGIVPFLYHTTLDWHWRGMKTSDCSEKQFSEYLDYLCASVEILCTQYGEIGGFWFDGNWSRPQSDWKLDRFYGMIRKHQPNAVIINNTGMFHPGELMHPEIDCVTYENQAAGQRESREGSKYVAAEMCETLNAHWGTAGHDLSCKSPAHVIEMLCQCRGVGANYLLNVGPDASGAIPQMEAAVLQKVGQWMKVFGEPIYRGRPITAKCQGRDFILESRDDLYYFAHDLGIKGDEGAETPGRGAGPRGIQGLKRRVRQASWMDNGEDLEWVQNPKTGIAAIGVTGHPYGSQMVVRVAKLEAAAS